MIALWSASGRLELCDVRRRGWSAGAWNADTLRHGFIRTTSLQYLHVYSVVGVFRSVMWFTCGCLEC